MGAETYYLIALVVLFALAVTDLVVGVSNDAVNFLNSAIGSKVTSRRNILIVATAGILVGVTFASGMMEIARKGVFDPGMFSFADLMIVFLAVMITDVVLLDLFNTLALPTSTTVSIVFELLGAACAVAFFLMASVDGASLAQYVNFQTAAIIISGIFLSVLIAFAIGTVVQLVSRVLWTFEVRGPHPAIGAVWTGAAMTMLTYFLAVKGLKGSSFATPEIVQAVNENVGVILAMSWLFFFLVGWAVEKRRPGGMLPPVVLVGTFSIALAFAGNDLVNFIGVPIAALESFKLWTASGAEPGSLMLDQLNAPVRTPTALLLIAGCVMAATLWLSRKAQSVTQTEISLARQAEGEERFEAGPVSHALVRMAAASISTIDRALESRWYRALGQRMKRGDEQRSNHRDAPAFDLVRAAVNLSVASALIAFATSLKLPLSTTYVSFMVAMGTSLADRAWGLESAPQRVSGVLTVVGGWIMTALIAFVAAMIVASLLKVVGPVALAPLVLLTIGALVHGRHVHQRRESAPSTVQP